MARWNNIRSATGGSISGNIDYTKGEDANWQIYQDEKPFLEEAKKDREKDQIKTAGGHKKFATIPDIVAIEILSKYGIDIHDPLCMHDRNKMQRFKQIIMTDYPYLVINKA